MRFFRYLYTSCLTVLFLTFFLTIIPSPAQAAIPLPEREADVPINQHTVAQGFFLESLSVVACQLSGIDFLSPGRPCLEINPETGKLSYVKQDPSGQIQLGGLLGVSPQAIGMLYTPMTSTNEYITYLTRDFGIVKNSYAAPASSFEGLSPVLSLWKISRDLAYYLLILVFMFIGLGIMLRVKIDPRTVMTIQNQIPNVIIAIVLITFSYAYVAIFADAMWATTYVGINLITSGENDVKNAGCGPNSDRLSKQATRNLLDSPFTFVNRVFLEKCEFVSSGILDVSKKVANGVAEVQRDLVLTAIGIDPNAECGLTNIAGCLTSWVKPIVSAIWMLIITIVFLITIFRIWFSLLKAFGNILIYTITGPIMIVFGLLPKKPLGFERLTRVLFVNFGFFPIVAWMAVLARVIMDKYKAANNPNDLFIPPLVGNPNVIDHAGAIMAFAMFLLIPTMLDFLREKMGVPPFKGASVIGASIAAGAGAAGAVPGKAWQHLNRRHPTTGAPLGVLANAREKAGTTVLKALPGVAKKWAAQKEYIAQTGQRASKGQIQDKLNKTSFEDFRNARRDAVRTKNEAFTNKYTNDEDGWIRWQADQPRPQNQPSRWNWRARRNARRNAEQERNQQAAGATTTATRQQSRTEQQGQQGQQTGTGEHPEGAQRIDTLAVNNLTVAHIVGQLDFNSSGNAGDAVRPLLPEGHTIPTDQAWARRPLNHPTAQADIMAYLQGIFRRPGGEQQEESES